MKNIRNFSIIAHIDHGKSTLSDRIIQICGGLSDREMEAQVLDSMDLERERGITIKAQSVTLDYKASDGETYQLNFIDTPGHVDFSYEVSRSLAACEGALLVVDAGQGVEAQTLANCYTAMEMDLEVVPVLNKIDLPAADPERVAEEIEDIVGIDATDAVRCSAKTDKNHQLNIANRAARRFVHQAVNGAFFFHMQARCIDVDRLIRAFSMDPHNAVTSCLRLAGSDGDFLPQQFVQQCGFANVRTSDDGNKSAVTFIDAHSSSSFFNACSAAACSALRRLEPVPTTGSLRPLTWQWIVNS